MTKQTNTIETFILTLSESQKLYNVRNNKLKHNRKSKIFRDKNLATINPNHVSKYKQTQPQTPTKHKPNHTNQNTKRIKPPLFYDSPLRGNSL